MATAEIVNTFTPLHPDEFEVEKDGVTLNVQKFANGNAMVTICDPETGINSRGHFEAYDRKPSGGGERGEQAVTKRITNLTQETRDYIRDAVELAVRYWPNSHLGDYSPREDIRSAFRMLRSHAGHHNNIHAGIGAVSLDAYRHMDM